MSTLSSADVDGMTHVGSLQGDGKHWSLAVINQKDRRISMGCAKAEKGVKKKKKRENDAARMMKCPSPLSRPILILDIWKLRGFETWPAAAAVHCRAPSCLKSMATALSTSNVDDKLASYPSQLNLPVVSLSSSSSTHRTYVPHSPQLLPHPRLPHPPLIHPLHLFVNYSVPLIP